MRLRRLFPETLRARITAAYVAGLCVVVAAMGVLAMALLGAQLRSAATDDLTARLGDLAAAVRAGSIAPVEQDPYAQVILRGRTLARSPAAPVASALTPSELARAEQGRVVLRRSVPDLGDDALLAASPLPNGAVAVVGTSLDTINSGIRRVVVAIVAIAPLLLVLLTLGVRRLVGTALRPVASLTVEANEIRAADLSRRLPVPRGRDEISALARTLNDMLDRIEGAYLRERVFLDDAAHELRSPVAVLRAELELGADSADPAAARQALARALVETDRLSRLTTDLLVLARARSGDLTLARVPTDVTERVRDLAGRIGLVHGIAVEVTGDELVSTLDPLRLDQVVSNLLANASAAGARRVRVGVREDDGGVALTVEDDGHGFPSAVLPVAFDRFSRGSVARTRDEAGGAGLGLAIVAAIARAHAGTADADNASALGGARVRVVLR